MSEQQPARSENLTPMAHAAQNRCFGCGEANPVGLHLEFFLAEDHSVVCRAAIPDSAGNEMGAEPTDQATASANLKSP